jgi:hypothetical protein
VTEQQIRTRVMLAAGSIPVSRSIFSPLPGSYRSAWNIARQAATAASSSTPENPNPFQR